MKPKLVTISEKELIALRRSERRMRACLRVIADSAAFVLRNAPTLAMLSTPRVKARRRAEESQ
jgi:hypothetical protein